MLCLNELKPLGGKSPPTRETTRARSTSHARGKEHKHRHHEHGCHVSLTSPSLPAKLCLWETHLAESNLAGFTTPKLTAGNLKGRPEFYPQNCGFKITFYSLEKFRFQNLKNRTDLVQSACQWSLWGQATRGSD